MRLRQVEVFHAIYTSGSMTAAAEVLNVTQPSISKVLAHAEQTLGYALFDRVRGKLVPTPEAERLFENVLVVYRDMEELRSVARNLRKPDRSRIRVAATPAFGIDLLPSAVASYLGAHDDTLVEIETLHFDEMAQALSESRVDIGLAFDPPTQPGIVEDAIADGEFVVLAPTSVHISDDPRIRLSDLAHLPFINLSSRGPLGQMLTAHLESSNVTLNTVAKSETYHVAKSLVENGVGVTIIDEITARSPSNESVRLWRLKPSLRFRISVLHVDRQPLSVSAKRFVKHLREETQHFLTGE